MTEAEKEQSKKPPAKPKESSSARYIYALLVLLVAIGAAVGWSWPGMGLEPSPTGDLRRATAEVHTMPVRILSEAEEEDANEPPIPTRKSVNAPKKYAYLEDGYPSKPKSAEETAYVGDSQWQLRRERPVEQVAQDTKRSNKDTKRFDTSPQCKAWAASGECDKNPGFMGTSCRASCPHLDLPAQGDAKAEDTSKRTKSVAWEAPVLAADLARAQKETDLKGPTDVLRARGCDDVRADCGQLARWNLSGCGEAPFMLTECRRTCGTCQYGKLISEVTATCADSRNECAGWAKSGECEANKRFMLSSCSASCGVCEQKKVGCSRRNTVPGLPTPTGLSDMFRNALSHPDIVAKHSPQALSTDPYVLQFENMVDPQEAQDMINRCAQFDRFERSMAGDQLSPVRTSTQCWCDDTHNCIDHPTVEKVTERMMNITGIPTANAEYFQILKYEKDQFYKVHHDQQTAHWTPQGVRVLTFFVYLSDVEEGGGTKFNDLGLVVKPKLGRAILWPSVKDEDLRTGEMRTHHEALPVVEGVKYAANLWIHLYDFKTPSRAGLCPFLGQNTNG